MANLTTDDRILRLEALIAPRVAGTTITRVMSDQSAGLAWCLAIGMMGCRKNFYYGASIEAAIASAEDDLLKPVVPTEEMCILLAKNPKTVFYKGLGIPATLNLDGIDLAAFKGRRIRKRAESLQWSGN